MEGRILVVDDEESIRYTFKSFLEEERYRVATAGSYSDAHALVSGEEFDLVFADIVLGDGTGIDVLREVKQRNPNCPVVLFTGSPSVETSSEAVRLGAYDYIPKPFKQESVLRVARMALIHKALADEKERYRANLDAIFKGIKDAIIMVDPEMTVLEANDAVKDIVGLSREELIGRKCHEAAAHLSRECRRLVEEAIRTKRPAYADRVEFRSIHRPGMVVSVSASPLLDVRGLVSGAVLVIRDKTRLAALEKELAVQKQFHGIVGGSGRMQDVYSLIQSLAVVDSTVLITGESGTGKELVAEALHFKGPRGKGPLIKVNCSALTESLLESELFGHTKGAFTGAVEERAGRFEAAHGGTILLDEIGDISPGLQLRLLRVLQNKEIERVGSSKPIKVDVRVIASTNRDLRALMQAGRFREDLYYRIKVVEINLPPLRERKEDIPLLVGHFIGRLNGKLNKNIEGVSQEVTKAFMAHRWPGNVRELEHALEHAAIVCRKNIITIEDLPADLFDAAAIQEPSAEYSPGGERHRVLNALTKAGWNKARAARYLGISRRTIYRKMKEYGIEDMGGTEV